MLYISPAGGGGGSSGRCRGAREEGNSFYHRASPSVCRAGWRDVIVLPEKSTVGNSHHARYLQLCFGRVRSWWGGQQAVCTSHYSSTSVGVGPLYHVNRSPRGARGCAVIGLQPKPRGTRSTSKAFRRLLRRGVLSYRSQTPPWWNHKPSEPPAEQVELQKRCKA